MNKATLPLLGLTLALSACGNGTGSVSIIGVDPRAELTVDVRGLPAGESADVTVTHRDRVFTLTGTRVLQDLPVGAYDITARTVMVDGAPYLPVVEPGRVTFTEQALRATTKVQYDLPLTGQLTLNVAGVPAGEATTLQVTGPNGFKRDLSGVATQTLVDLAPGQYNVTATPLRFEDFTYPATIQGSPVVVERGRTGVVNVAFARDPRFGHLAVRVLGLPEGTPGDVRVTDAAGRTQVLRTSGILTDLARGDAQVTPADVKAGGMTYRAPTSVVPVMGADVASVDVTYVAVTGRLRVAVNSPVPVPAGSVVITGHPDVQETTTLDDLTPGTYDVTARPFTAGGWTYVPEVTGAPVTVRAGSTAGTEVTFRPQVAQPGLSVDVTAPQVSLETDVLGADRTLRGRVSDDRGPVRVTVFTGSVNLGEASVTADGTWSLGWPDAPSGPVDVTVVATDDAGNQTRVTRAVQTEE